MTKNKRGGLGRGLGALIPTSADPAAPSPTDIFFGPEGRQPASEAAPSEEPTGSGSDAAGGDAAVPTAGPADSAEMGRPDAYPDAEEVAAISMSTDAATIAADTAPTRSADDLQLAPVPGAELRELLVTQIQANPRQPRTVFDDDALEELTHSVREFGVLQPIVVREVGDAYELVMGERRLRAAIAAGLETVPSIVRATGDDAMLRDALLENIHRAALNPLEEAAAYQQLLEEFDVTHEELAKRIGRSRSHLSNTVRLMNLSVPVQRRVAAGVLSAGHARALLALTDGDAQDELASRIVAEGLSVRATEELVTLAANGHLEGVSTRRRASRRFTAPAATDLAEKLSDAFETKVRIDIGQRKGKITVEFASIDDLERIVEVMVPGLAGRRSAEGPIDAHADESSGSSVEPYEP